MVTTAATAQQTDAPSALKSDACPFSLLSAAKTSAPTVSKIDTHPLTSVTAATTRAQTAASMQTSYCPFGGAQASVTGLAGHTTDASVQSDGCLGIPKQSLLTHSPESSSAAAPAATCPFSFSTQPTPYEPAAEAASGDADTAGSQLMTDDVLKEYEHAFSLDPDEAMMHAYAALLADKVAEADTEADTEAAAYLPEQAGCPMMTGLSLQASGHPEAHTPPDGHSTADGSIQAPCSSQQESRQRKAPLADASTEGDADIPSAANTTAAQTDCMAGPKAGPQAELETNTWAEPVAKCKHEQTKPADWAQAGQSTSKSWMAVISSLWHDLLQQPPRWHVIMLACFGIQLAMTLYFSLVHQRFFPCSLRVCI